MAHRIQIARAWCDECLQDCFFSYDESTGRKEHLGASTTDLGRKSEELKERGFVASHRSGVFTYTRYNSQPLALPLDWQMAGDERESVDVYQDW